MGADVIRRLPPNATIASLPTPDQPATDQRLFADTRAKWVISGIFLALLFNWLAAVARYQVNVLYWDQWGFFTPITEGGNAWAIFDRQHGPHRQGLAFLITSWIMGLAHWDERIDSLWIAGALGLSAILTLLLKWRVAGPIACRDAWILFAVLTLSQCDSVITVPNASHSVFPLLLMLTLCHVWLTATAGWQFVASGLCTSFLIFTGFGLFPGMVSTAAMGIAGAVAHLRGNERAATGLAIGSLLAVGAWVAFSINYRFDPAAPGFQFPWHPGLDYVRFVILMMTAPAGWKGAYAAHYALGAVLFGLLVLAIAASVVTWSRKPLLASPAAVVLLLGLSSLLFAADAAIGRVQMGVDGGLTSRYITLILPAFLGLYLWSAHLATKARSSVQAILWLTVLLPYAAVHERPLADWPGSLGASEWIFERMRAVSEQKLGFVMGYQLTHDTGRVAEHYGAQIYPRETLGNIEPGLDFQRRHGLSFFGDRGLGYAPWWHPDVYHWIDVPSAEPGFRWLGRSAELEIGNREPGYLNVNILGRAGALPEGAMATLRVDGTEAEIGSDRLGRGLSVPLAPGPHSITLGSRDGTVRAGGEDDRQISFSFADPTTSALPRYTPWIAAGADSTLKPAYELTIVSGFHGWENEGAFGWTARTLTLSARAIATTFLNVQVDRLAPHLPPGPISLTIDARTIVVPSSAGRAAFSVPIPPDSAEHTIVIDNESGDIQPSVGGGSTDDRRLALKLKRLSVMFQEVVRM